MTTCPLRAPWSTVRKAWRQQNRRRTCTRSRREPARREDRHVAIRRLLDIAPDQTQILDDHGTELVFLSHGFPAAVLSCNDSRTQVVGVCLEDFRIDRRI